MKKSPVYPKHETNDYINGDEYEYEYDPQADFSQFLEEAKRNEKKTDFGIISLVDSEEEGKKNKKKKKKPWKFFVFPWWKGEKKSKPHHMEPETYISPHVSNRRRGFASGPVSYNSSKDTSGGHHRPTSGPLSSLFNPTRKADSGIPYMCLNQLNTPRGGAQTYGPVYLVT